LWRASRSTAVWAGFFLTLGAVFGGRIGHLLNLHREGYIILPAIVVIAFAAYLVILLRRATPSLPTPT
jgi:membrane protein DedA with SNARE-associated domain